MRPLPSPDTLAVIARPNRGSGAGRARPMPTTLGMQSSLRLPIRLDNEFVSALAFASRERAKLEKALPRARFNKSKAASALGLARHQLYLRLRKYGIET